MTKSPAQDKQFRQMLDAAPDAMVIVDLDQDGAVALPHVPRSAEAKR